MKKYVLILVMLVCATTLSVIGCRVDAPITPSGATFSVPSGWPQPVYTFAGNTLTEGGFQLGRKLFYDGRLSKDSSISCSSCHQPFAAFSHFDHPVSHGIYNQFGTRNAPALFNLDWHNGYFWDGGVINLENQPINPIQNPVEMDEPIGDVVARINADPVYRSMFKTAFGSDTVNSQRIFKALAQFMGTMVSSNSKYDKYMRGEAGGAMTDRELRGLALVREKCEGCHKEPLFSDYSYRNNGLAVNPGLNDSGRAHITRDPNDLYKFKVPSLRNLDYTLPYMHDGRFETVDAVLEHYRTGIVQSPTLDPLLTNGISMSDSDKADIIVFLKTLDDTSFVNDARFSQPQ